MAASDESRRAVGLRVVIGSAITAAILGLIAMGLHEPFVFPSLGPTMFLLLYLPLGAMAAPRNVIVGHAIGIASGVAALAIFGLLTVPADLFEVSLARVGAIVVALSLTFALMLWWGFPHAPAGATTLIVALGILRTPLDLAIMMLAVLATVACAFVVNRVAGIDVPIWSERAAAGQPPPAT